MVDRGRVGKRLLSKSQIRSKKTQGCHQQLTVRAGDRLKEVTVKAGSTVWDEKEIFYPSE